ncbi:MAG: TolB-like 6-bladed beta-propeller domain-containing protein [Mediterranea sp.]|jgi:hypothetical protein|nr:TolB-like 6-bladed beta-propeller domain-containing protein [Mediterranea sp.]
MNRNISATLFLLISSLVFYSCSQSNKYQDVVSISYNDFPPIRKLTGKSFLQDKDILKPIHIYTYDTLLVTVNLKDKKLFNLYSLANGAERGQRISLGQGPNEMISPSIVRCASDSLLIFDAATSTVFQYNTRDFIQNGSPEPIVRKKIETHTYSELGCFPNGFVSLSISPKNQFIRFNSDGTKISEFGNYPASNINYTDIEKMTAYQASVTTNLSDKMAVCYKSTDLIEIFNWDGKLLKRVQGPEHSFALYKEEHHGKAAMASPDKNNKDAYFSPHCVGDKLFVLFSGKVWNPDDPNSQLMNQILVFYWNGKPIERLLLDDGIVDFAVDQKHNKIYAIISEPEFHIMSYDL